MSTEVELYDGHYEQLATEAQGEVRRETYGEDLGQASWITGGEAREWFDLLRPGAGQQALEVACGSGGVTCAMARQTGARCVGIDINVHGIEAANKWAEGEGLSSRVSFQVVDAGRPLPFSEQSFDVVFCNDSINHLPDRFAVLQDWHRILRPGGRILFTDPIVVTGQLTNEEIRIRSSIGFFLFTPTGHNEQVLERTGFTVRTIRDVTEAVASVSRRWHDARAKRRGRLVAVEGREGFDGLQRFLNAVHVLSSQRRLSRYAYLAEKRSRTAA
jgi:ubiquinone/menaquinone biosynthesis C-methylase UbiE